MRMKLLRIRDSLQEGTSRFYAELVEEGYEEHAATLASVRARLAALQEP